MYDHYDFNTFLCNRVRENVEYCTFFLFIKIYRFQLHTFNYYVYGVQRHSHDFLLWGGRRSIKMY
jgi:hypothetical protein